MPNFGRRGEVRAVSTPATITELRCPDCNTELRQIDSRPGKEAWAQSIRILH